jgi:hypothetical protein
MKIILFTFVFLLTASGPVWARSSTILICKIDKNANIVGFEVDAVGNAQITLSDEVGIQKLCELSVIKLNDERNFRISRVAISFQIKSCNQELISKKELKLRNQIVLNIFNKSYDKSYGKIFWLENEQASTCKIDKISYEDLHMGSMKMKNGKWGR